MHELKIENAGQVVRYLRVERGLGLNELAEKLKWDKGRLSKYETDQLGMTLSVLGQISKHLGLTPEVLVFECLKHLYPSLRRPNSTARKLLDELIIELAEHRRT